MEEEGRGGDFSPLPMNVRAEIGVSAQPVTVSGCKGASWATGVCLDMGVHGCWVQYLESARVSICVCVCVCVCVSFLGVSTLRGGVRMAQLSGFM